MVNGHLRDHLIGREIESIADIQATYDVLYMESLPYGRKGLGVMALSGIDLALYDLLGKARDLPVCALLSEARSSTSGHMPPARMPYVTVNSAIPQTSSGTAGQATTLTTILQSGPRSTCEKSSETMRLSWSTCTCPGTPRLRSKCPAASQTTTSIGSRHPHTRRPRRAGSPDRRSKAHPHRRWRARIHPTRFRRHRPRGCDGTSGSPILPGAAVSQRERGSWR